MDTNNPKMIDTSFDEFFETGKFSLNSYSVQWLSEQIEYP